MLAVNSRLRELPVRIVSLSRKSGTPSQISRSASAEGSPGSEGQSPGSEGQSPGSEGQSPGSEGQSPGSPGGSHKPVLQHYDLESLSRDPAHSTSVEPTEAPETNAANAKETPSSHAETNPPETETNPVHANENKHRTNPDTSRANTDQRQGSVKASSGSASGSGSGSGSVRQITGGHSVSGNSEKLAPAHLTPNIFQRRTFAGRVPVSNSVLRKAQSQLYPRVRRFNTRGRPRNKQKFIIIGNAAAPRMFRTFATPVIRRPSRVQARRFGVPSPVSFRVYPTRILQRGQGGVSRVGLAEFSPLFSAKRRLPQRESTIVVTPGQLRTLIELNKFFPKRSHALYEIESLNSNSKVRTARQSITPAPGSSTGNSNSKPAREEQQQYAPGSTGKSNSKPAPEEIQQPVLDSAAKSNSKPAPEEIQQPVLDSPSKSNSKPAPKEVQQPVSGSTGKSNSKPAPEGKPSVSGSSGTSTTARDHPASPGSPEVREAVTAQTEPPELPGEEIIISPANPKTVMKQPPSHREVAEIPFQPGGYLNDATSAPQDVQSTHATQDTPTELPGSPTFKRQHSARTSVSTKSAVRSKPTANSNGQVVEAPELPGQPAVRSKSTANSNGQVVEAPELPGQPSFQPSRSAARRAPQIRGDPELVEPTSPAETLSSTNNKQSVAETRHQSSTRNKPNVHKPGPPQTEAQYPEYPLFLESAGPATEFRTGGEAMEGVIPSNILSQLSGFAAELAELTALVSMPLMNELAEVPNRLSPSATSTRGREAAGADNSQPSAGSRRVSQTSQTSGQSGSRTASQTASTTRSRFTSQKDPLTLQDFAMLFN